VSEPRDDGGVAEQSRPEVERLLTVYREYMPTVAARWDPGNRGNAAILSELEGRATAVLAAGGRVPLDGESVLDVGCGYGHFLGVLASLGADPSRLHGIDLVPERVEAARHRHPGIDFRVGNGAELPFEDGAFDLVLLFSVFTSILDPAMRRGLAAEVTRVLRVGGAILWYDFRYDSPRNPNVRGVGRAEIDRHFPGWPRRLETMTLLPPLARRLGPLTPTLYRALGAVPLLRSHYIGLLERPAEPARG
jgi:SAM-dependent methyltransferase